jgi:hypothetical protein
MMAIILAAAGVAAAICQTAPESAPQTTPQSGDPANQMNLPNKVPLPAVGQKPVLTPQQAKLDSGLLELSKAQVAGGAEAASKYAQEKSLPMDKALVKVKIILLSEKDRKLVRKQIRQLGGKVSASFQNNVYAAIPASAVTPLAANDQVSLMSLDSVVMRPQPQPGAPK